MDDIEGQGFRQIGDLTSKMLPSLRASALMRAPLPSASETTGMRGLVPVPANSIGPRRGETGVANLPTTLEALPALMALGDPEATDRALEASWRQRLGSSPVRREEARYDGEYGFEIEMLGYERPGSHDEGLYEIVATACQRATPEAVTVQLARLRVGTIGRNLDGINMDAWLTVMGDELEQYPIDVVRCACRKWLRREKWTPSVAELVEECERLVKSRRLMEIALRRFGPS